MGRYGKCRYPSTATLGIVKSEKLNTGFVNLETMV